MDYVELQKEFKKHCEEEGISFDDIDEVSDETRRKLVFWYKEWTFTLIDFGTGDHEKQLYLVEYVHDDFSCSVCHHVYTAPFPEARLVKIAFPEKITNDNFKNLPNEIKAQLVEVFNSIIFHNKLFPFLKQWKEEDESKSLNA